MFHICPILNTNKLYFFYCVANLLTEFMACLHQVYAFFCCAFCRHFLNNAKDILLNVFLAIAVDNLADAENMTKIDEEEKQKKKDAKRLKKLAKKMKMDSVDSEG